MTWTKDLPAESGFYWYREGSTAINETVIVEFDAKEKIITFTGNELGVGGWWKNEITGEFWSERLRAPT